MNNEYSINNYPRIIIEETGYKIILIDISNINKYIKK